MYAIAKNYFDRHNRLNWLVRGIDQPSALAAAVGAVLALDVKFVESNQYESGFGCSVIAEAKAAHWTSDDFGAGNFRLLVLDGADRLSFDGYHFRDPDGKAVAGADALFLLNDGTMYAAGVKFHDEERRFTYPKGGGKRDRRNDFVDDLLHRAMIERQKLTLEDLRPVTNVIPEDAQTAAT